LEQNAQDPERCIEALLRFWLDRRGRDSRSLGKACERVAPTDAAAFFQRIISLLDSPEVDRDKAACAFFCGGAYYLVEKLADPEPLLSSAVAHGCWQYILRYPGPDTLKERFILQGLAACQKLQCGPLIPESLADCMTSSGIASLQRIVRDLRDKPSWAGFRIAAQTLAELDDTSIAPDLEYALQSSSLDEMDRNLYHFLLVRGRTQNDPQKILETLRTERKNVVLLDWAMRRSLQLKLPASRIEKALRENGSMAAASCERFLWLARQPRGSEADLFTPADFFNPFVLTGNELREYRRAQRHPGSGAEVAERHTLRALVASAPASD